MMIISTVKCSLNLCAQVMKEVIDCLFSPHFRVMFIIKYTKANFCRQTKGERENTDMSIPLDM